MEEKSMTALVSAFSRAFHFESNSERIFSDPIAKKIISEKTYNEIADNMASGIKFFCPTFKGSKDEALRFIVDKQLAPSVLGRAAFCEKALETAVKVASIRQYLIFAAGYDSFTYRQPNWTADLEIFEIDRKAMIEDKAERLKQACISIPDNVTYISTDLVSDNFKDKIQRSDKFVDEPCFCSIMGLSYYLEKQEFIKIINNISSLVCDSSTIVFDYPVLNEEKTEQTQKQQALAGGANEKMKAEYTYKEIEKMLSDCGFLIYEHLTPDEITEQYFKQYNTANPQNLMKAFDNVNYCLAVKK